MCQLNRTALALSALLLAAPLHAEPPRGAAPMIGDFAYDHGLHAAGAGDLDPLPFETSEDLDWMIHDSRPLPAADRPASIEQHIERSAPFRFAHRLGADEVIVPVWTLHL